MKAGTIYVQVRPPEKSRTECFDGFVEFTVYEDELESSITVRAQKCKAETND